jgi:hypothetical protein
MLKYSFDKIITLYPDSDLTLFFKNRNSVIFHFVHLENSRFSFIFVASI